MSTMPDGELRSGHVDKSQPTSVRQCVVNDCEESQGVWKSLRLVALVLRIRVLFLFRLHQLYQNAPVLRQLTGMLYRREARISGVEIHPNATIGPRFNMPHPNGIVIGRGVLIGREVTVFQQVTLGGKEIGSTSSDSGYPVIENFVVIYAGAKIIGDITVGRGSVVGANAVVLTSLPPNSVAVGIPARIRPRHVEQ